MSLIYFRKSSITFLSPVRVFLDLLVKRFDQMRRIQTSPDRFGKAVKESSFFYLQTIFYALLRRSIETATATFVHYYGS